MMYTGLPTPQVQNLQMQLVFLTFVARTNISFTKRFSLFRTYSQEGAQSACFADKGKRTGATKRPRSKVATLTCATGYRSLVTGTPVAPTNTVPTSIAKSARLILKVLIPLGTAQFHMVLLHLGKLVEQCRVLPPQLQRKLHSG